MHSEELIQDEEVVRDENVIRGEEAAQDEETVQDEDLKKELVEKLMGISASSIELPETINENLVKFGHLLDYEVMLVPGGTSRLYMSQQENENLRVMSGFALMEDDVWQSHAWLVMNNNNNYKIIDNVKAKKYFGVVMPY